MQVERAKRYRYERCKNKEPKDIGTEDAGRESQKVPVRKMQIQRAKRYWHRRCRYRGLTTEQLTKLSGSGCRLLTLAASIAL
jgi:hypothetical protein